MFKLNSILEFEGYKEYLFHYLCEQDGLPLYLYDQVQWAEAGYFNEVCKRRDTETKSKDWSKSIQTVKVSQNKMKKVL